MKSVLATAAAAFVAAAACSRTTNLVSDEDGVTGVDGGAAADAAEVGCVAGSTECSDCIDNDGDDRIDGFDSQCTGAADRREDSFETDIPGDGFADLVQDCFFDGEERAEDDACELPLCCVLEPLDIGCPASACEPSAQCLDGCMALVIPGCDCLGCCTICDGSNCETVFINPVAAPLCTPEQLDQPFLCPECTQLAACAKPCDPEACVLCPGQTAADLPAHCAGPVCADGSPPCETSSDCGAEQVCAVGCCIDQVG